MPDAQPTFAAQFADAVADLAACVCLHGRVASEFGHNSTVTNNAVAHVDAAKARLAAMLVECIPSGTEEGK